MIYIARMAAPYLNSSTQIHIQKLIKKEPLAGYLLASALAMCLSAIRDLTQKKGYQTIASKISLCVLSFYIFQRLSYHVKLKPNFKVEHEISDRYLAVAAAGASAIGQKSKEIVFIVIPHFDYNNSCSMAQKINRENVARLAKTHRVEWVRARKFEQIEAAMSAVDRIISHLWILTHGCKNSIQLSKRGYISRGVPFPNLAKNAHILLSGCSTGEDEGIGELIALTNPGTTIFAPIEPSVEDYLYLDLGKPSLLHTNRLGECITRVIQAIDL